MNFSLSRPIGERFPVPRRKAPPEGILRATQATLVGPLDGVLDASSSNAASSLAATHKSFASLGNSFSSSIARNPQQRNLLESDPNPKIRPARHLNKAAPIATVSHLSTATLTGGLESESRLIRGRRVVPPPTQEGDFSLFKARAAPIGSTAHKGRKMIDGRMPGGESGNAASISIAHKKPVVNHPHDTPNLLRFSPRIGARREGGQSGAAVVRPQTAPTGGRASTGMRGALTWSGPTPRYVGNSKSSVEHRPLAASATLLSRTTSNAPFDTSFRARQEANAAPLERRAARGTQRVATRPKSARGILTWA